MLLISLLFFKKIDVLHTIGDPILEIAVVEREGEEQDMQGVLAFEGCRF